MTTTPDLEELRRRVDWLLFRKGEPLDGDDRQIIDDALPGLLDEIARLTAALANETQRADEHWYAVARLTAENAALREAVSQWERKYREYFHLDSIGSDGISWEEPRLTEPKETENG